LTQKERRHRGLHSHEGHDHVCGNGGTEKNYHGFGTYAQGLDVELDTKVGTGLVTNGATVTGFNTMLPGPTI